MCGIAGIYSFSLTDSSLIREMKNSLHHRGPDTSGIFEESPVALAHARLSIIDLSENAAQPMTSRCGRYVIAFNGEVYNFQEIRMHLVKTVPAFNDESSFRSLSDTEAVLELFASEGPDCVNRLNGMFAFSIYDRTEKKLYLFRDRIGIKPLFYSLSGDLFLFASEMKTMMRVLPEKVLNTALLPAFLRLGYFPEPETVLKNVYKLPSGHYGIFDGRTFTITRYWSPADQIEADAFRNYPETLSGLKTKIEQAVSDCLISDVPVGVFLSGGIDSSLVASVAAGMSSQPLHTFTVAVPDNCMDESHYAQLVARKIGTTHHKLPVEENTLMSVTETVLAQMDEPFADSSLIPTYLVSKLTRNHVKVALSGDGGDELFMGYGAYRWARRLNTLRHPFLRNLAFLSLSFFPGERYRRVRGFFSKKFSDAREENIFSVEQNLFSNAEVRNAFQDLCFRYSAPSGLKRKLSPEEHQAFFDLTLYLKDDLLVKVDRASMMCSLEVRPPLLDHRLVSYALNISPEMKLKNGEGKVILKDLLSQYIPRELFERPKKGFSIPLTAWLRKEMKPLVSQYLESDQNRLHQIIPRSMTKNVLHDFYSRGKNLPATRIWTLLVLSRYLEDHPDILLN